MFKSAKPIFIYVETPLHVGSGSDLGIIDLPIQRERHTDFPKIEGSSLKGCIREAFEERAKAEDEKRKIHIAFGYDPSDESEVIKENFKDKEHFASAIGFADAKILLFPVKSIKGVFAWITCPRVLNRFKEDLEMMNYSNNLLIPSEQGVPLNSQVVIDNNKVVLEEFAFEVKKDQKYNDLSQQLSEMIFKDQKEPFLKSKLKTNLVVLNDDDFKDFVINSTEVITRTKIDNLTGTVSSTALFNEEYLPSETVLYSMALFSPVLIDEFQKSFFFDENVKTNEVIADKLVQKYFVDNFPKRLQIGANSTIGKGIVKLTLG
ncbi:type III-B CRISPR module RAMP protein Cmr4 [Athalassotoga saccharophila]|uniref:type III-B CRISPR module RAMP protein Cmr4 n=1 Tax=Athalassotoga saccharophila TaxID=1441386 RepID=UPI00137B1D70|nr:type III-B CRISPR module RAMP protein Cmr4 [Athalassotoga saccharophila]BBJ28676.1 CRISPR-associated RAMP Cmr4 [Athalassotoga saccharophila]